MKKFICAVCLVLSSAGVAETPREKFAKDWERLVPHRASLQGNTLVVWVNNTRNNFRNPDDYAYEYHPKLVNGQSCKELGLKFIQVRNYKLDKMLSGIICKD